MSDQEDRRGEGAATGGEGEGVLTLVCLQCGKEYFFSESPPEGLSCEKCAGTVFRSFYSPEEGDEAAEDFRDSTSRDLDPDDAEGEAMPGDVIDLNRD
jgi:hypothetical protein